MAYQGNSPAANFQSLPAVQRFNGDGSDTTFTLASVIANDQSILVSVDGVTQDSNAYSVSGTTLTFTAAPSSGTGNIFVHTISPVGSTVVPPDGIAINATTGTFSDDVDMGVGSNITLDSNLGANSTTAFASMDGRIFYSNDYSDAPRGPNKVVLQNDGTWISGLGISNNSLDIYSGGDIKFNKSTNANSYTKQVTILSGGGIAFNNDTAAANALDDYEEGTWSPQIYLQNSTDQSNASNQTQDGRYTKIGNIVTLQFSLIFTLGSSLNNDNIGVKNFPFTSSATIKAVGGVMQATSLTSGAGYVFFVEPSGSKALLLTGAGGGNLADEVGSGSGKQLYGSIVYQTG